MTGPEEKWILTLEEGSGYVGRAGLGRGSPARAPSTLLPALLPLALSQRVKLTFLEAVEKLLTWRTEDGLQPHRTNFGKVLLTRSCFLLVRFVSVSAELQCTVSSGRHPPCQACPAKGKQSTAGSAQAHRRAASESACGPHPRLRP